MRPDRRAIVPSASGDARSGRYRRAATVHRLFLTGVVLCNCTQPVQMLGSNTANAAVLAFSSGKLELRQLSAGHSTANMQSSSSVLFKYDLNTGES